MEIVTHGQRLNDPQFIDAVPTHTITRYDFNGNSAQVSPLNRSFQEKMTL